MQGLRSLVVWFILYVLCFQCGVKAGSESAQDEEGKVAVTIHLGALRITNRCLQLRCKISNQMNEDVWVFASESRDYRVEGIQETNADVFVGEDSKSLIILRQMKRPYHGIVFEQEPCVSYNRLHAGESRTEELSVGLPIILLPGDLRGFEQAIDRGVDALTRLVFQIGYYTTEELTSRLELRGHLTFCGQKEAPA
jgi:hypothetical protein